jgi:Rps23 Pro-64 3,4-dihydroxylase Tpa1-like proline 4-hydroxylase
MSEPVFDGLQGHGSPFPHFRVPALLPEQTADALLGWFEEDAPWQLKIADFYEQLEFSLLGCAVPEELGTLVDHRFLAALARQFSTTLQAPELKIVDVVAHRMEQGQTIRIHNDYLGGAESHRCVIQVNRGWTAEQGGLFMMFAGDDPGSVTDVLLPVHRSALGFEISERSHHAVSTIHAGTRDTLVYTYRSRRA